MTRIVAIVPARQNSKSISKKNLQLLGKHPLLAYSIAAAKLSSLITEVVVTTDGEEIAEVSRGYGANVPFLRPAEISQDHSTDLEFFQHYLSFCREHQKPVPDYMVHLRPTSPLREIKIMDQAIQAIVDTPQATALRSVTLTSVAPHKLFHMEGPYLRGFFPDDPRVEYYNLPRQELPETYLPNGQVDVVKSSTIDGNVLHGDRMLGYKTEFVPEIDYLEDFQKAEFYLRDPRFRPLLQHLEDNFA